MLSPNYDTSISAICFAGSAGTVMDSGPARQRRCCRDVAAPVRQCLSGLSGGSAHDPLGLLAHHLARLFDDLGPELMHLALDDAEVHDELGKGEYFRRHLCVVPLKLVAPRGPQDRAQGSRGFSPTLSV
jgi:hypothetical protein